MAKLPEEILTIIFTLQRQIAEGIEDVSAAEWLLLERYGEIEATIPELEELQNTRERLTAPYSRLHTLLLRILESQPIASAAMLETTSPNHQTSASCRRCCQSKRSRN